MIAEIIILIFALEIMHKLKNFILHQIKKSQIFNKKTTWTSKKQRLCRFFRRSCKLYWKQIRMWVYCDAYQSFEQKKNYEKEGKFIMRVKKELHLY